MRRWGLRPLYTGLHDDPPGQPALSAKGFIANYNQTLIKNRLLKAKKLAKHLEVSAGEGIFLYYNGETAGGFYCRTESRPICTDWQTFFMGTLETGIDKAKGYVACCRERFPCFDPYDLIHKNRLVFYLSGWQADKNPYGG